MENKIIAFIPARGGSKGLPRKNIKPLLGKPLVAWTIEQAKNSKYVNKVVVSTEDKEIAEISRKYGAEVVERPEELAQDNSPVADAIMHTIDWFEKRGEYFDIFVTLDPTSPLRDTKDIDKCVEILTNNPKANAIVGVAKLESTHPDFNFVINKEGFIVKLDGTTEFSLAHRQDLEDIYFFEGSIYMSRLETLKQKRTFYHESTLAYVVPKYKSFEIDELCDFICIEALMKAKQEGKL